MCSYDAQGSLLREQSTDLCRKYLYNDFHQCIGTEVIRGREEEAERILQENRYDGEGLRFSLIENGRRTDFITNGWENLAELDENGQVTKRIIRGMGIVASEDAEDNVVDATAAFTGTAYHYYHGNERMDVEYITDEAGQVVNGYTYDAFGTIITSSEKLQNRYTYNGEAFDKATEQYYLRKRFYNPKLSRFIQEDEYRGDGLNLYAFCANNPVMYVDPSGYEFLENLLMDSPDDVARRMQQVPSENASYGEWAGKRGDSNFVFSNSDNSVFHNNVEALMKAHGATYIPYKNGQVDFDYFAVFTVDTTIAIKRDITKANTNQEIARIIVEYNGDYAKMYADNVMGIASGSKHSQDLARQIIDDVSIIASSGAATDQRIQEVYTLLEEAQVNYKQTVHEENLVEGQKLNKTQWVDTDINKQFGHAGGTSDEKARQKKCSTT